MNPSLEELATVVHVVTCGSVTAAADRLRTTKSVVSKRLANLEAALGTSLFHRSGRKMQPTDVGLHVYERGLALLAGMDGLVEEIAARSGTLRGTIRVADPLSFGNRYLSPLISDFLAIHSQINIRFDLDDRFVDLRSGNYDFSIRIGRLEDSTLKARKLATSRRSIYCSQAYAQHHGLPGSPEQLSDHVCLSYANAASGHVWRFESTTGDKPRSLSLPARLLSNSGEALRDAAIAGIGIAALPAFLAKDSVQAGTLMEISLPEWGMASDTIYAIYPETIALPLKVRAIIDYIASRLRPPFPWE